MRTGLLKKVVVLQDGRGNNCVNDPVERDNAMLGAGVQGNALFLWEALRFCHGKGGKVG